MTRQALLASAIALALAGPLSAPSAWAETPAVAALAPTPASIDGVAHVRGKTIAYRATAAETVMRNAAGAPRATIFSVAYVAKGADARRRPVTFLFNGGPGGATIALREGLGPVMTANATTPEGFAFVDNPDSLIDASDLVFVDAPGTGYSRMLADGASAEYWGVDEDARAMADFITGWLEANGRTASPRFLVGESYAGTRVGFVADLMARRPTAPMNFNGVVLISPTTSAGGEDPRMPKRDAAVTNLPSEASVAWFHGRGAHIGQPVEAVAEAARKFAEGPYAAALAQGDKLDPAEKARIRTEVAGYTGLSEAKLDEYGLRVPLSKFVLDLLADKGERAGLSDGRAHALRSVTDKNRAPWDDPSSSNFVLSYKPDQAVADLYGKAFGYKPMADYVRLSYDANSNWNNKVARGPSSIPLMFKDLMARDPTLKITMVMGYFDMSVPYDRPLGDYLAADLPASRFSYHLYRSGHSVFSDEVGRAQSTDALRDFYRQALPAS
jgi:carboxypeptidase C (cathepsin A)